ncbi:MAG: hypothetical protein AB7U34_05295 [Novosphingobium sp.]
MDDSALLELAETLPTVQRLALAYAPRAARVPTLALMALDQRLARVLSAASEPIAAQLRLAWWRDTLRGGLATKAPDPLLTALNAWQGRETALIGLVDAWEEMLLEAPAPDSVLEGVAMARGASFAALADLLDCNDAAGENVHKAGSLWAFADLAAGLGNKDERAACLSHARSIALPVERLPRQLRPLAVLSGLGTRSIVKGRASLLAGPVDMMVAMRIGMTGR